MLNHHLSRRFNPKKIAVAGIFLVCFLAVSAFLMRGRGLGLWRLSHMGQAVLNHQRVVSYNHHDFSNIIFLHHSTGRNLIEQGKIRAGLAAAGYQFWDHDYNWPGLTRPDGSFAGYSYNIPNDNTNPDGLSQIFNQPAYPLPVNAASGLLQYEVIIFKSCFPVSHITSNQQLTQYQSYYLTIRNVTDQYPHKIFIVMTPPPLNPAETNAGAAARARAFANWLKSDEYLGGHLNLFTFDFFDYLAESNPQSPQYNQLRQSYQTGSDSHPNQTANEFIGPIFVKFITDAIEHYRAIYFLPRS